MNYNETSKGGLALNVPECYVWMVVGRISAQEDQCKTWGSHINESMQSAPRRKFLMTGMLALMWNLIGVMTYLMEVMMTPETLAELPPAEAALRTDIPVWVTSAYAIAVFGGTLACVGLLLRKAWAVPLFAVSLLAILGQMGHALLLTEMLAVLGPTSAIVPIMIIAIAVVLLWYSVVVKQNGIPI